VKPPSRSPVACRTLALSEGFATTGRGSGGHVRHCPAWGMEPSPTSCCVMRDAPEELTSPMSFPVPAGISKSCVALGSCRQNPVGKAVIGPLPRSVVGRNGAVVRSLTRDGSHANVLGLYQIHSPRRIDRSGSAVRAACQRLKGSQRACRVRSTPVTGRNIAALVFFQPWAKSGNWPQITPRSASFLRRVSGCLSRREMNYCPFSSAARPLGKARIGRHGCSQRVPVTIVPARSPMSPGPLDRTLRASVRKV
jgi:hypothetical protein